MQTPFEEDIQHYREVDPRVREEVGGILEHAFRHERGALPEKIEVQTLEKWATEVEAKAEKANQMAEDALDAARRASEQFALSHSLEDMEAVQQWEAEAASYRREADLLHAEAEQLRKYLPG